MKTDSFEDAYGMLEQTISKLCIEHSYLEMSSDAERIDQKPFLRLKERNANITDIKSALDTLLRMMKAHYGKNVILLVDEYDVPLAKASDNGYYKEMLNIIKMFLGMTKNLELEGYKTILCYGAAFRGKTCLIKLAEQW